MTVVGFIEGHPNRASLLETSPNKKQHFRIKKSERDRESENI